MDCPPTNHLCWRCDSLTAVAVDPPIRIWVRGGAHSVGKPSRENCPCPYGPETRSCRLACSAEPADWKWMTSELSRSLAEEPLYLPKSQLAQVKASRSRRNSVHISDKKWICQKSQPIRPILLDLRNHPTIFGGIRRGSSESGFQGKLFFAEVLTASRL